MVSWILQLKGFNLKYDIEYLNNGTSFNSNKKTASHVLKITFGEKIFSTEISFLIKLDFSK